MRRRTAWTLAALAAIAALAAAAALVDTGRLTVIPPRTLPEAGLRTSTSTIMIPLSLSLDLIEKRLNDSLPGSLHSFEKRGVRVKCWDVPGDPVVGDDLVARGPERNCLDLDFEVRITRNGHIEVSGDGEELVLRVPARGRAVARGTGPLGRLVRKTARGEFTVTMRGRLDVTPAGAFALRLSSDYAWDVPAHTKVLGREIDLREPVDRLLRKGLDKVEGRVRRIVEDETRLGALAQGTLRRLLEPVPVGLDPGVWLVVAPKALHFTGIRTEGDRVLAPVAVEAELRSHVGSRPEYAPPQALPLIDGRPGTSRDFVVRLPIVLSYAFLQAEFERKLAGTAIPLSKAFPGAAAVITKTHFYPSGEKLALGVAFHTRGVPDWLSVEGTVFLVGTPRVSNEEKMLTVTDLAFARRTSSSFLNVGSYLLYRPLLSYLRKALRYSLEDAHRRVIEEANAAFNRKYAHGITLRGSLEGVAVDEIQTRKDDLVVYARGRGRLEALLLDE